MSIIANIKKFFLSIKEWFLLVKCAKQYRDISIRLEERKSFLLSQSETFTRYKCYSDAMEVAKEIDQIEGVLTGKLGTHYDELMKFYERK